MKKTIGKERAGEIIDTLHTILKPFLLRRMKTDVEINLPPKKEYVLYAPLSASQHATYSRIIDGTLRAHLIGQEPKPSQKPSPKSKTVSNEPRKLRSRKAVDHTLALEDDDDVYFDRLESGEAEEGHDSPALADINAANKQREYSAASGSSQTIPTTLSDYPLSQESEQHEATKHRDAATQSLLASLPIRLACRHSNSGADP